MGCKYCDVQAHGSDGSALACRDAALERVEVERDRLSADNADLRIQLAASQEAYEIACGASDAADAERDQLRARVAAFEHEEGPPEGTRCFARIAQADHDAGLLQAQVTTLKAHIAELTAERDGLEAERDHYRERARQQSERVAELEAQLAREIRCDGCGAEAFKSCAANCHDE